MLEPDEAGAPARSNTLMTGLPTPDPLRERPWRALGVLCACLSLVSCAKLPVGPESLAGRAPSDPSASSAVAQLKANDAIARLARILDADSLARSVGSQVLGTVPELDL